MNRIDVENRVAIVTGAAGGLGKAVALRLARSGAHVIACDRDLQSLSGEPLPNGIEAREIDVADPASVADLFDAVSRRHGRLDILVHSAAILGTPGATADYDPAEWDRILRINLTGTFLVCRAAIPHMAKGGYGRIVNVSSAGGKDGHPRMAAYVASKAGVIGFTKSLGKEVASQGIIVNCVTPGAMDTPMGPNGPSQKDPEVSQRVIDSTPLGRIAQPDEVASLICWLASAECSYTTAATFDASGGRTTY